MMKKIFFAFTFLLALLMSNQVVAQDVLQSKDLSSLNVDYLSDSDLSKIEAQLESNHLSIEQAESLLLSKGMSSSEYAKLKSRLAERSTSSQSSTQNKSNSEQKKDSEKDDVNGTDSTQKENSEKNSEFWRKQVTIKNNKVKDSLNALVYGSELFDNPTLDFAPNLQLATPINYILGPGDELQVSVYGVQQYNEIVPVTVEGKVSIAYVGELAVAGMSIEAATQKVKNAIAGVYRTVASGQSKVSISLSTIRTIRVTVIGAKQPGNYSISSLASVYNALHLAGGPAKNGSYRSIELLRDNKVFSIVDIYDFLVKGDQSANVGLKDNDVIRIPAYSNRVTVEGEVKRPGIFEMKKGENFASLLSFASGFTESAYTASVNVLQKTSKEFKVRDVKATEFESYLPQSGDVFRVTKILNRFENRIKIEGAVFRPDTYSFYEGMRVSDLIVQADGLKDDAYGQRARITRLRADLTTEIVNVALDKALQGDFEADIPLKKEDVVTVYSVLDFVEEYKITIDGEIKKPGIFDYYEGLTLNDLLIQAGGLTGSASKRVEVARMMISETIDAKDPSKAQLFNVEITPGNNEQAKNFELQPFDVVNIRRLAVYDKPEMVNLVGAVAYPGKYVLVNKKDRVYDVIQRAGGLTSLADIRGVMIKRPIQAKQIEDLENINLNLGKKDSIQNKLEKKLKEDLKFATIPVDWETIIADPKSSTNVTLFEGDEIVVALFNEGVKVTGNVLLTSEIPYNKGKGFNYYLNAVGGVDNKAWKKKSYIIYPNGKAAVAHSFLFFRSYPNVTPGSQIIVPEKADVKKLSTAEYVSIGSVIASLALLFVTAFK